MTLDEAMERLQLMHDLACAAGWTLDKVVDESKMYKAWIDTIHEVWHPIKGYRPVWVIPEGVSPYLFWNDERVSLFTWRKQREQQSQTDD